ncbi:MAG: 4Fe-4S dicluster domain-containing protein [Prolixibacteraceae bacterium]|nr:4Fe-4S dicluster domain-containing protein [Prolixibacteraceae bacterium]
MNEFAHLVSRPSRQIDYQTFDNRLLAYVLRYEPSFLTCMSCGGCTATCSAGKLTDFNIRRIGLMLRRGQTDKLAAEIDKCMFCGKCSLVCPRDVNIRNVVLLIKKESTRLHAENQKV